MVDFQSIITSVQGYWGLFTLATATPSLLHQINGTRSMSQTAGLCHIVLVGIRCFDNALISVESVPVQPKV